MPVVLSRSPTRRDILRKRGESFSSEVPARLAREKIAEDLLPLVLDGSGATCSPAARLPPSSRLGGGRGTGALLLNCSGGGGGGSTTLACSTACGCVGGGGGVAKAWTLDELSPTIGGPPPTIGGPPPTI
eukprot:scaffold7756_cov267-Pinguiococcus_pyrenoidosus.AAC.1